MKGYHNKVNSLAVHKNKTEVTLVINLFQSVLDGFIRGEIKRVEAEPAKVSMKTLVCIALSLLNLTLWISLGYQDNKEEEEKRQMRKLNILSFYFIFFFLQSCELFAHFSPQPDNPLDHRFSTYQVNVMQSCDLCGSYIWGMERAYMCSGECKTTSKLSFFFFNSNMERYKRDMQFLNSTMLCSLIYFSLQANLSQKMSG